MALSSPRRKPDAASKASPRAIQARMVLDPTTLKALADPVRSFLVYSLVPQAKTVKTLAQELGVPVTRLYYHVQRLQALGLVFVEKTRMVSGIPEKHYRAAARELVLDRAAFAPEQHLDRGRSEALLGFVFDQSRLEIARALEAGRLDAVRHWPDTDALMAVRTVLRLDQAQAERLYRRLGEFWMEYEEIARNPAPDGKFYALVAALYPNAVDDGARTATASPRPRSRKTNGSAPQGDT
jgi:Helix-turn-helix domain